MTDLLMFYALFLVPALVIGLPPWSFVSGRVRLTAIDALQLLAPCLIWMGLVDLHGGNKSLANLIKLPILGATTGLFFAGRLALSITRPHLAARAPLLMLAGSCLSAAALWGLSPGLPE